jgi:hypothetical protein
MAEPSLICFGCASSLHLSGCTQIADEPVFRPHYSVVMIEDPRRRSDIDRFGLP